MPAGDLRAKIRRRLATKDLFLIGRPGRPERGSGSACAVCASVISTTEAQYSVPGPTNSVVAHLACYVVWRKESEAVRLRGGR
jgi:hypothetical protein